MCAKLISWSMLGEVDQRPSLHAETTTVVLAPDASSLGGIKSPEATVAMFWLPFSYLFFHSTLGNSVICWDKISLL